MMTTSHNAVPSNATRRVMASACHAWASLRATLSLASVPASAVRATAVAACVAVAISTGGASAAHGQAELTPEELHVLRIEATPIGALPRIGAPMPASRDHNYWGLRAHGGMRGGRSGPDMAAIAGGVDFQLLGGSVFGATAGYQERECTLLGEDCGGHFMFEGRARINLLTGSSRIGAALGDYSSTVTLGTDLGFGYAPDFVPGQHACTVDLGVPVSLGMFQKVRLVGFLTPGVIWAVDCGGEPVSGQRNYMLGSGIGVQQLLHRGLDVHLGLQKIFRAASGYQFGLSVTWTLLP
ncbi:MAG TPA: hypothetical protein VK929_11900 [Longimicrobiales bacterium]|nr:hypothetical protein [Longimicrobiales bacterium]